MQTIEVTPKNEGIGQRGFVALLTVVLLVIGAVLGTPGQFPTLDGTQITPDYVGQLLAHLAIPLGLGAATLYGLFRAITKRVSDPTDPFQPGDIVTLLKSKEFWTYAVAALVGIAQLFGIELLNLPADKQAVLVTTIMGVLTLLLGSWGNRAAGSVIEKLPPETPVVNVTQVNETTPATGGKALG